MFEERAKAEARKRDGISLNVSVGDLIAIGALVVAGLCALRPTTAPPTAPSQVGQPTPYAEEEIRRRRRGQSKVLAAGAFIAGIAYFLHVKEALAELGRFVTALSGAHTPLAMAQLILTMNPNDIIVAAIWSAFIVFPPAGFLTVVFELIRRRG